MAVETLRCDRVEIDHDCDNDCDDDRKAYTRTGCVSPHAAGVRSEVEHLRTPQNKPLKNMDEVAGTGLLFMDDLQESTRITSKITTRIKEQSGGGAMKIDGIRRLTTLAGALCLTSSHT